MTLLVIVLGTLLAGIGSVWLAAWLSFGVISRYTRHMLSLAAGALLATAFLHLLPEAFESGMPPHVLFAVLLVGLVFFFLLDKAELWHHGHEHHHADAHQHTAQDISIEYAERVHDALESVSESRCRSRARRSGSTMKDSVRMTTQAWTHHNPSRTGTVPLAIQTFAAEIRLKYTK